MTRLSLWLLIVKVSKYFVFVGAISKEYNTLISENSLLAQIGRRGTNRKCKMSDGEVF